MMGDNTATNTRPVIGYTTRDVTLDPLQWAINIAIRLAGGKPLRLRPAKSHMDRAIDGLVIGGGTDLYPTLYHFDPKPDYEYDQARDEMEIAWLKRAEAEALPVLGICRGAQLMNVHRGGTLHVDVAKVYENAEYPTSFLANVFFRKSINVTENSLLQSLIGTGRARVNSIHKQAIDEVGHGLKISAQEDNDVVQAIEDPDRPFHLGVQFHPEILIYRQSIRQIFEKLIEASRLKQVA